MVSDNGGARAIRGFNFQDAVISLVCIRNYNEPNFHVFIETDDDFEVLMHEDYHAYIQVKSGKSLSVTKLANAPEGKISVFEKNFSNGDENSVYKIVVHDFSKSDIKKMSEKLDDELFGSSYSLSSDHAQIVNNQLIDKFSLVVSDFAPKLEVARTFLTGEMVKQGISVDNKNNQILDEMFRIISQKSEFEVQEENDRFKKLITTEDLNYILRKTETFVKFKEILQSLPLSRYMKALIEKENIKIEVMHYELRLKIAKQIQENFQLEIVNENEIIMTTISSDILTGMSEAEKYAVTISAYCNILEGVLNV
ncbi:dsDNA nuclease domain-containing protein [Lactococcus formosensis]|uniref:dsDNA nuclease domain-containing protein n=1 Tax=Lactococcus formosensis TaxID=1281486 RepID=UPI00254A0702|nr:dsDNA nuclease domain-containing protein [Lactococcus formosensis]